MLIRAESKALVKTVASPLQSPQTEVAVRDRMPSPRRILLLLASIVGAAMVGWIAAASMAPETRARSSRQAEDLQVELLMQQFQDQDELSEAERGLLLERLVTLERLQEAEVVLQPWLSSRSTPR